MASVYLAYLKTPRIQIAALLYFLIAGVLTQLPLFNYLGYEFSALLTIPTAFISGTLTILFLREHRVKPLTRRTWLFVILDYLSVNMLLLLIPFIVISLNAFSVKNCAYFKGVSYFFLLPVMTMVFSVSLALIVGTVARKGLALFFLILSALLLHIVVITYTQPQLFAYNFILGFFPGITYDEILSDITPLIIYRQFTLIASLMMIALFIILLRTYDREQSLNINVRSVRKNIGQDKMLWGIVALCAITLGTGHFYRDSIGFEFSGEDIQHALGRRTESKHFIMYYHNEDYSANDMRRIKAVSEYYYHNVASKLKTHNDADKKIEVFMYPDGSWKHHFIGTSNTNIAKPWKREMHLTSSTFSSTFRHELVHILAAEFGYPVIKASTRMGLNEGLAVAVDWDEGLFTPHQYAAAIQQEKGLENVEQLFSYSGFAQQSGSFAYLIAGSFSRYLLDRYGIDRFRSLFPNGNFVLSFGESLTSLVGDWKVFLRTVDATEIPPETVTALFFQQSIFYKTCARQVAEQNQRALQAIRVKNFQDAENEFTASYSNAPTAYALRGIFQSLNSQQKPKEVIRTYAELPPNSSLKMNPAVLLLLADAYYMDDKVESAGKYYSTIRSMNYSESFIEATALRLQFVSDRIDTKTFHSIFYSGLEDSVKSAFVRNAVRDMKSSKALQFLEAVLADDTDHTRITLFSSLASRLSSMDLKYFSLLRSAHQLFSMNRFEDAKRLYWQAKNYVPTRALGNNLDERIEMCDVVSLELQ